MNLSIYGGEYQGIEQVIRNIGKALEKDGHLIRYNQFSTNTDIIICPGLDFIYPIYRNLKGIKKRNIKIINLILDIPLIKLRNDSDSEALLKEGNKRNPKSKRGKNKVSQNLQQFLYHNSHKNRIIYDNIKFVENNKERNFFQNITSRLIQDLFYKTYYNAIKYTINYRNFLKKSDLNLSISKFTARSVKKFLNLDSEVFYPCVDSDFLLRLEETKKIKYDAINIGRIVDIKNQKMFVEAASQLGLNIAIIGKYQDRQIKLNCPHFYFSDHKLTLKELNRAKFFVDCSLFEGFGMTPVEAAFLEKVSIVSDTTVHKEVLGEYPLYFEKHNIHDLVDKMKMVRNGDFTINGAELKRIKKKYSIQAAKNRLLKHIETII